MEKINIIVFPYRSINFKKKYGPAVRDIQIIELLKNHPAVNNMLIVERPLSLYEIVLGRHLSAPGYLTDYSLDLLGPLKGRTWTEHCYKKILEKVNTITKQWDNLVVLDFTPIAKINKTLIEPDFYWYDAIDNFTKHNRFSIAQRKLVAEKYAMMGVDADLITGVTDVALKAFNNSNTITMPNGVYPHPPHQSNVPPTYKYGFFGFITDKFDISFIERLIQSDPNAKILLCGEVLDKTVGKKLKSIKNVTLHGSYSRKDTAKLASQFQVGIIPYLKEKSHDGSPLKLYEYMWFGKPTLTSIDYEYGSDFILNYNTIDTPTLLTRLDTVLTSPSINERIKSALTEDFYTEYRLNGVIDGILKKINKRP